MFEAKNNAPWMEEAVCRSIGVEAFFPEKGDDGRHWREAVRTCDRCPVKLSCEDWVMGLELGWSVHLRHGIVAGRTPTQRKKYEVTWLEITAEEAHGDAA